MFFETTYVPSPPESIASIGNKKRINTKDNITNLEAVIGFHKN